MLDERQKSILQYFNPTEAIISPEQLKGRDQELKEGLFHVSNRDCIIVQGARRIGKTSFLHCLREICLQEGLNCIYISFQRISEPSSLAFIEHLTNEICQKLEITIATDKQHGHGLYHSLTRIGAILNSRPGFKDLFVVFIDEFQTTELLAENERCILYNQIRNVIDERPISVELQKFVFVISTSQSISELSIGVSSTLASSFPKTFTLGCLSIESCIDLVHKPLENFLSFNGDIVNILTEETGRHPYLIKLLIHSTLIKNIQAILFQPIKVNFYDLLIAEAILIKEDLSHHHFAAILNSLKDLEKQIVYLLCNNRHMSLISIQDIIFTDYSPCTHENVKYSLRNLVNFQIIKEEKNIFNFTNNIYREWFTSFLKASSQFPLIPLRQPLKEENNMIPILFLTADPTDASHLRLGQESREIHEKLQIAKLRDSFGFNQRHAVRVPDFIQALLDTNPRIVHFSGHGRTDGALCFEDELGRMHPVDPDALSATFELFANQVECVVLNACYSEKQAKAIAKHIQYVVGMNQAINDKAAIGFAVGFYQAIGAGKSFDDAYKLGCASIKLQNIPQHLAPVLMRRDTEENM